MANSDFNGIQLSDPLADVIDTDWHQSFIENCDLYLCSRGVIEQAHAEAPTAAAKAYIFGICESRRRLALMSGREMK